MIWVLTVPPVVAAAIIGTIFRLSHRRPGGEEELWGPAKVALVEAEVLSPLDAPECPAVDTAWLRSEYSREQYERAFFEAHHEMPRFGRS